MLPNRRKYMRKVLCVVAVFASMAVVGQSQRPDDWIYNDGNRNWDRSWNDRPNPRAGACLFKDPGFRGDRFCVRQGDRLDHLPGSFGDKISSIQLYGGARIMVYNDRNFTGGSAQFRDSVADLHNRRFRGGHTWNDRISSIMVR